MFAPASENSSNPGETATPPRPHWRATRMVETTTKLRRVKDCNASAQHPGMRVMPVVASLRLLPLSGTTDSWHR